ncbi:glycosyltransferase family 4 protein [Poriferisphaera sp. WC338]|uniref:glycosyltransferase family 4 protein n=1 Tax=Poriferisphaera sp. WC338 TaxID=3425129 RepID=UPI003D8179C9
MNILIVTGQLERCGIGVYTQKLADHLAESGHQVAILTCPTEEFTKPTDSRNWAHFTLNATRKLSHADWLPVLAKFRPDVIHIQYPSLHRDAFFLYRETCRRFLFRKPIVTTFHEKPYQFRSYVLMFTSCHVITVRSVRLARDWGAYFPCKKSMVLNATMLPEIQLTDDERSQTRRKYGHRSYQNRLTDIKDCNHDDAHGVCVSPDRRRLILSFGFLTPHNRTQDILHACNPVTDDLVIAGTCPESIPEHLKSLHVQCSEAGWNPDEVFRGYVSDDELSKLIASADAIVLPYQSGAGPWNTSLLAAQQQGTFVLTTTNEQLGMPAVGYHQETNTFFAPIGSIEKMKDAIARYQGHRNPPVSGGRTWQQIADEHYQIYTRYQKGRTRFSAATT